MVEPLGWTIVGDRMDVDEAFIPISGPRDLRVLTRLLEGPTEEERMASRQAAGKREADRYVQMRLHKLRHMTLLRLHSLHLVSELLEQHQPREVDVHGGTWLECHGCPSFDDGGVEVHHEWPCPTWQTISDSTA